MNKITKRDIVEGIGFILMVLSIVVLMGAMYQLREVNKEVKDLLKITNRK